jgi:opacity protein-like surface antigen
MPTVAQAQSDIGVRRVGIRGGLTVDPDQGHIGMHVNAGNFAPRVRFQPSFEIGFGSNRVVGMINIDAFYDFDASGWSPYLGGGLGVGIISRDRGRNDGDDDVNVEAGVNLVGGFEWGEANKYLLEARVGIGDIPDFKLTVGLSF